MTEKLHFQQLLESFYYSKRNLNQQLGGWYYLKLKSLSACDLNKCFKKVLDISAKPEPAPALLTHTEEIYSEVQNILVRLKLAAVAACCSSTV